ncbi:Uu.00g089540.m01.CDS01 [Anthostomella pinea]|uniref:Uu.00g089540.m01.CDS01 n=1 Tax=Anthostomella pinea TaxID=933095 RepID=A0AAI8VMU2_9PEZI|nr:Uu.00g089540.m01.CDS01 [Anthostomella pinea]
MASPLIAIEDDDVALLKLSQLCLPPWDDRVATRTLRPERPEYAMTLQLPPSAKWDRSVAAILYVMECNGDALGMESNIESTAVIDTFVSKTGTGISAFSHPYSSKCFLWTMASEPFQYMPVPGRKTASSGSLDGTAICGTCQGYLNATLFTNCRKDHADFALMLYYYHTHRQTLEPADYRDGMTGYTGVLQEIISQVPLRGNDELARKLSVDVNELIPKVVRDAGKRARMIAMAEDIADRFGIPLRATENCVLPKPVFDTTHQYGLAVKKRTGWIGRICSWFSEPSGPAVTENVQAL